jgi:hypothetical protein
MKKYAQTIAFRAVPIAALLIAGCLDEPEKAGEEAGMRNLPTAASTATTLHPLGAKRESKAVLDAHRIDMLSGRTAATAALPASLDYTSKFPLPGNQGFTNSCVGWAVGYGAKSFLETVEEGWNTMSTLHQFSPSWIYNQINGGVDNGAYTGNGLDLVTWSGDDAIEFFPFTSDVTAPPTRSSYARAGRHSGGSWGVLPNDPVQVKTALNAKQAVIITFDVYPDWDGLNSANPIYNDVSGASRGNHANVIIGYDDTKQAFKTMNSWGTGWGLSGYAWIAYSMVSNSSANIVLYSLTDGANYRHWQTSWNSRAVRDVNNDGKADMIGFGNDAVYVSLSNGSVFGAPKMWLKCDFIYDAHQDHIDPNPVRDVNNDGKADLIGFNGNVVSVALSNGSAFGDWQTWTTTFPSDWDATTARVAGDVNGDFKVDAIGFAHDGIYVSTSTGTQFNNATRWTTQFSDAWGAHQPGDVFTIIDVNGDKKQDAVLFNANGVYVALSTGTGFGTAKLWSTDFKTSSFGAHTNRILGDVNGDGKADVVGISLNATYVALSNGSSFAAKTTWAGNYGFNQGFDDQSVKVMGDVTGDGKLDLVATKVTDVHIGKSTGTAFSADAVALSKNFAYNTNEWYAP